MINILSAFMLIQSLLLFMGYRNDWLLRKRMNLIFSNKDLDNYIPRWKMMLFVWIWDIEKMKKVK